MPHLTLLGDSATSPFNCKVRIVLDEKKLPYDYMPHSLAGGEANRVIKLNPLSKIPVLVVDDQEAIFDSRVIIEYLEYLSPSPALLLTGMERVRVRRWEALADGICEAGRTCKFEYKRSHIDQEIIRRHSGKYVRGLEWVSTLLGDQQWCHGNAFSLADIAIGTAIAWIGFHYPDNDPRKRHGNLDALYQRLMKRPAFALATEAFNRTESAHASH